MIKFYLSTVLIYFIVYVTSGILFKKEFIKARNKLRKELNDNRKIYGNIRTTFTYLLISFIPFIRLCVLISKFYLIIDTKGFIENAKKKESDK